MSDYSQLTLIIKLFYLSGDHVKKHDYKSADLKNYVQEFKLKILNTENVEELSLLNNSLNTLIKKDLDTLLLLKIIYTINFKDLIDQNHSNRTLLNTVDSTYSKLTNALTEQEFEYLEKNPYLVTLIIQNLYFFYKIYHQLNVAKYG